MSTEQNVTSLEIEKLAREMMTIFPGNEAVHAEYWEKRQAPDWRPGMKRVDGYKTVRGEPVTPDVWIKHLTGKRGLGLALAMDNGKCRAAALDTADHEDGADSEG